MELEFFDWRAFLEQWSRDVLMIDEAREDLPQDVIASGWLGYPGATEEQLAGAEDRLGVRLPPSYRAFLSVSNGWRLTPLWIDRLWSTEEVEWFAVRNQDWIDAWTEADPDPLWTPDSAYFVYGAGQNPSNLRLDHMQTALEISPNEPDEESIRLLNPQVVTAAGEWEAWYLSNLLPGARRYRSFQEMMQEIYADFIVGLREQQEEA